MTLGISPKVKAFIAALGGPGIVLLIIALATGDTDLRTVAISLLGGAAVGGGAGYVAPPGEVAITVGPPSDDGLSEDAKSQLAALVTPQA